MNGPRIPAAPRKQYGEGAQYGLRKSQRCPRYGLLPELRQGPLPQLRAQRRWRSNTLRAMLHGISNGAQSIRYADDGRAQSSGGCVAGTDPRRGRDVQRTVLQGTDPRGDLRGADQHYGALPDLWIIYCGVDPVSVV